VASIRAWSIGCGHFFDMSRDFRDDVRDERPAPEVERTAKVQPDRGPRDSDLFGRHLDLPRGGTRERMSRDRQHFLNENETRALATIGTFRVVPVDDLIRTASDISHAHLRHLSDQGLITRETVTDTGGSQHIVSLTREGKEILEMHRNADTTGPQQAFYSGVVKPRELAHDAQVYRAFKEESGRIEADGGRVTRVVLDYELKREYQSFLNREDRPDDATLESDRRAFAEAHDLHIVRGHLELPDLRIEYETKDGRLQHCDVEILTEHYSRGQISAKARAGFTCYRLGGRSSRRGGTPFDPRHLSRLS
jgi:DNA-binding MarR family transcriptional regulator